MYEEEDKKKRIIIAVIAIIILIIIILLLLRGCKKEVYYSVTLKNGNEVQTITTDANGFCEIPENPEKDGYTFIGWYLEEEKVNFDEAFDKDTILEAKWKENESDSVEIVEENENLPIEEIDVIVKEPVKKNNDKKIEQQPQTSSTQPTSTIIDVNEILISNTSLELEVGSTYKLNVTVKPENATDKNITWSSSNSNIATVDKNGNVIAKSAGNVTIIATAGEKNVSCSVNIKDITYSIEWKIEEGTAIEQYRLYIKGSNGKYVSGTVEITTLAGDTFEETVTENGSINSYIKSAIESVRIK